MDKRIVATHAASQVVYNPAEERNDATVKPKKVKEPTVLPKTAVAIVKSTHLQKTWMIILLTVLGNGVCCLGGKKIRYSFTPVPGAAAMFAVDWGKLSAIFLAVAMDKIFFKEVFRQIRRHYHETTVYKDRTVPTAQSNPG